MKPLLFLFFFVLFMLLASYLPALQKKPRHRLATRSSVVTKEMERLQQLKRKAAAGKIFAARYGLSLHYVFLLDMGLPSGKARFFIYDLQSDTMIAAGLVAHGSCNARFLEKPVFSNVPECGCSSVGRYKTGHAYEGRFGLAFKLYGLDSTNSNAYQRSIVLHSYRSVPDKDVYPQSIGNSLGCPMISPEFLAKAAGILQKEKKPLLLWIYQ